MITAIRKADNDFLLELCQNEAEYKNEVWATLA